ncbi:flagellar protein [Rhizobium oryzicola]|uniref:Flagellar protein n=1 Tax=Rhizobium oryzicola TaxID=1232668 RepID=A0ABT8SRE5_9HYPH|nr:flagellar protein [Rhizobium oryzicola]MDO1581006.1 flagellar protein [Rhizobium oryzicola]
MSNDDVDETIEPIKPRRSRRDRSDQLLIGCGIVLASASALFPWYVFFNQDKFGLRVTPMDHTRDLPDGPARNVFSVSPLALINKNASDETKELPETDRLTTATVPSAGKDETDKSDPRQNQPLPGKNTFRLMHVANGRALIEDASGMYMVKIGSILPDNSRLATIEQRQGKWVIVTSNGEVYGDQGQPRP